MDRRSFLGSLGALVVAPRVAVEACVKAFDSLPAPAVVGASGYMTVAQAQALICNMIDEVWEAERHRKPPQFKTFVTAGPLGETTDYSIRAEIGD